MDIQTIKLDLIQWLAGIQDPATVLTFLKLRQEIEKTEDDPIFKPMTKEELIARAVAANKAIEEGDVYDIDELVKEYL